MKAKKICYVTTISLSIKAFFIPQLKRLAEEGYSVTVVTSPDDKLQEMLGDKIRYIPVAMPRGISLGGSFRAVSALTELFRREQFDLVQYSTPNAALYASVAAKKVGIKVRNYHLMGLRFLGARGWMRALLKSLEKKACKHSTHIECVSNSNLEIAIKEKLFPIEKATVVWNGSSGGVDLKRFDVSKRDVWRAEKRTQYAFDDRDFVYGFVGRATRDKGIQELFSAFRNIRKCQPGARLVLIGNLDDDHHLDEESVRMLASGEVTHIRTVADVEKYYPMLDALVLPSYREGFGNVVIEAQAMGVPVVVSDIPGPTDAMVDGQTGYVVRVKDADDLCEKMEKVVSKEIYARMSAAAVDYVKTHFDGETLCNYIVERKKELLGD